LQFPGRLPIEVLFVRRVPAVLFLLLALLPASPLGAATFRDRNVDDRWYEGRAVSTTYGAYECLIRFHGDQVFLKLAGIQIVGVLDDEVIGNPHDILAHDPKRGVDWTIDCYNLGS
jgi:hypothetical protein